MRTCLSGQVLLHYPHQFCRLADSIMNNADDVYILSLVTEKTGNDVFARISSLCCPHTVSSFVVCPAEGESPRVVYDYLIEHDIQLYITDSAGVQEYLRKNSDIPTLLLPSIQRRSDAP